IFLFEIFNEAVVAVIGVVDVIGTVTKSAISTSLEKAILV
ncbi:16269_t:CDS:1, partial [Gigaspora rosea]